MTGRAIEPLDQTHDLGAFNCGYPALDAWLRDRAIGFTLVPDSRPLLMVLSVRHLASALAASRR